MEINKKLEILKKSVNETSALVDKLIYGIQSKKQIVQKKEEKIKHLKDEVRKNVDKIDKIIENYNVNS